MNEEQKKRLREFANTYGSGSSKVFNLSVDEQLEFFNAQLKKVSTWKRNVEQAIDDLTAQKLFAKLTPKQRAELLRKMK